MPVQVSFPGVYIQEVPSGVHTITGVSTSIGAFFGRTARGSIDKAVRCLSFADFLREFGGPHPLSDLGQSVRQFFDNGGTDCYVVRLAKGAVAASITLKDISGTLNVLKATAKDPGLWAQNVLLEVDYNTPTPDDTFNFRVIYVSDDGTVLSQENFNNLNMKPTSPRFAPSLVTQSSRLIDLTVHSSMGNVNNPASVFNTSPTVNLAPAIPVGVGFSEGRRPFVGTNAATLLAALIGDFNTAKATNGKFSISINGGPFKDVDLSGTPAVAGGTPDTVAASITTLINSKLSGGDAVKCSFIDVGVGIFTKVLRISSASGDSSSVNIRRSPANDLAAPMMLGLDQGGIEVSRWSNLRPVPNGSVYVGDATVLGGISTGINVIAGRSQENFNKLTIDGTDVNFDVTLTGIPAGSLWYEQPSSGVDGVRQRLPILVDAINNNTPDTGWKAELWGYHIALRKKKGAINDVAAAIASAGNTPTPATLGNGFVSNVRQYGLGTSSIGSFSLHEGPPANDGTVPLVPEYVGNPTTHTGFNALDKVDLFNLMVLPGDREIDQATFLQIVGPASIYCYDKRAFLLLDAPDDWTNVDIPAADATKVNALRLLVVKDHSAVFYPKVQYSDAGLKKFIGPSGMIAGLMARIDSTRGVWKAAAGTEADLRGVLDVDVNLTDLENGVLNKLGVNCIRKFPAGIVNWGARTLDGSDDLGSEWKYIPIRRLALFLEESLFRGTKWVVFEPNDEPLWASIRLNLNAFMMSLFRQGAFQGATPDKAFYVKCDGETTTQNDRNLGIVNIEVGFAPLKPAEFVIIKIQQIAGDLT